MIGRGGLGLITSSNFYVPQVNLPGSMASFIKPAGILLPPAAVVNGRRGLGQEGADSPITSAGATVILPSGKYCQVGLDPGCTLPTYSGDYSSPAPIATGGTIGQWMQQNSGLLAIGVVLFVILAASRR